MNKFNCLITIACLSSLMLGCSTKEKVFKKEDTKTMKQIYNEKFSERKAVDKQTRDLREQTSTENQVDYTRTASSELTTLFPEIPNPKLSMYVYPHITPSNLPVPGYSTTFFMFKERYFALPGELKEPSNATHQ